MIFINYNDIYEEYLTEENEVNYRVVVKNATTPINLNLDNIVTIEPLMTKQGKLYKNVSLIKDRYDKIYKVVGNYRKIINAVDTQYNKNNNRIIVQGYGRNRKVYKE
jgi:hypothetical protein